MSGQALQPLLHGSLQFVSTSMGQLAALHPGGGSPLRPPLLDPGLPLDSCLPAPPCTPIPVQCSANNSCDVCSSPGRCTTCAGGWYMSGKGAAAKCVTCKGGAGCALCAAGGKCLSCKPGFQLSKSSTCEAKPRVVSDSTYNFKWSDRSWGTDPSIKTYKACGAKCVAAKSCSRFHISSAGCTFFKQASGAKLVAAGGFKAGAGELPRAQVCADAGCVPVAALPPAMLPHWLRPRPTPRPTPHPWTAVN